MRKEEFQFLSSDGKTNIRAVKWTPDSGEYKAVFQITHGMQEFIDRYDAFAEFLTQNGFLVVGHDHLGHGGSTSDEVEWGFLCEENGTDKVVEDIHTLRTMIQGENQDKPYFILGHSFGSYMLRRYLTIHGEGLTGAIVMGTGFMSGAVMGLGKVICKTLATFKGWHYCSPFVKKLSFAGSYAKFDVTGTNPENSWLSKNVENVKWYYKEPRCTFPFTINGYYCLMDAVQYDCKESNTAKIPKNLPIFIVSGEQDPVGDLGVGVKKVYEQMKKVGIQDVTYKLFENDRHEILNEPDKDDVYNEILSWLMAHML